MIPKLTSPLAIAMLAKAKNPPADPILPAAPTPRPVYNSRTAEKFVLRISKEIKGAIEALGTLHGRSANSEIVFALKSSLEGRQEVTTDINSRMAYLGPERAALTLQQVVRLEARAAIGTSKKVARLPDGVRDGITDMVERSVAEGGNLRSMNSWCLDALVWWINNQRESHALLQACVELDQERAQVRG